MPEVFETLPAEILVAGLAVVVGLATVPVVRETGLAVVAGLATVPVARETGLAVILVEALPAVLVEVTPVAVLAVAVLVVAVLAVAVLVPFLTASVLILPPGTGLLMPAPAILWLPPRIAVANEPAGCTG